jgi:hypothetical protein
MADQQGVVADYYRTDCGRIWRCRWRRPFGHRWDMTTVTDSFLDGRLWFQERACLDCGRRSWNW